jgi:hypothetical protein
MAQGVFRDLGLVLLRVRESTRGEKGTVRIVALQPIWINNLKPPSQVGASGEGVYGCSPDAASSDKQPIEV